MIGYRKFIVVMFAILCASLLVGMGRISDSVYSTIVVAAMGGFLTANYLKGKTISVVDDVEGAK